MVLQRPKTVRPVLFSDGRRFAIQENAEGKWRSFHNRAKRFDVVACDGTVKRMRMTGDPIAPTTAPADLTEKLFTFAIVPFTEL